MLLDGHSLAFRAFYALPAENFKTHSGQATNAVYGFTSMLINLLRDEQPTHLAAAFDVSRQTLRADLFPEYKAQRAKAPDEFKGQIDITTGSPTFGLPILTAGPPPAADVSIVSAMTDAADLPSDLADAIAVNASASDLVSLAAPVSGQHQISSPMLGTIALQSRILGA